MLVLEAVEGVNPRKNSIEKVKELPHMTATRTRRRMANVNATGYPPEMPKYIFWACGIPLHMLSNLQCCVWREHSIWQLKGTVSAIYSP